MSCYFGAGGGAFFGFPVALIFFSAGVVLEHCVIGSEVINGVMGLAVIGRMGECSMF